MAERDRSHDSDIFIRSTIEPRSLIDLHCTRWRALYSFVSALSGNGRPVDLHLLGPSETKKSSLRDVSCHFMPSHAQPSSNNHTSSAFKVIIIACYSPGSASPRYEVTRNSKAEPSFLWFSDDVQSWAVMIVVHSGSSPLSGEKERPCGNQQRRRMAPGRINRCTRGP